MNCKEIQNYLPLYTGREICFWHLWQIRMHLKKCADCRRELEKIEKTRQFYIEALEQEESHLQSAGLRRKTVETDLWPDILERLPHLSRQEGRRKMEKQRMWQGAAHGGLRILFESKRPWRLAVVIAAAVTMLILLLQERRPSGEELLPVVLGHRALPVVEQTNQPGVTVMTFQTDDPKVTIVWFFRDEPDQGTRDKS